MYMHLPTYLYVDLCRSLSVTVPKPYAMSYLVQCTMYICTCIHQRWRSRRTRNCVQEDEVFDQHKHPHLRMEGKRLPNAALHGHVHVDCRRKEKQRETEEDLDEKCQGKPERDKYRLDQDW